MLCIILTLRILYKEKTPEIISFWTYKNQNNLKEQFIHWVSYNLKLPVSPHVLTREPYKIELSSTMCLKLYEGNSGTGDLDYEALEQRRGMNMGWDSPHQTPLFI